MNDKTEKLVEPWKKWTVKPVLQHITATPPEAGVGARISYCRGQLDNLSIDALARYTKYFDEEGVSRQSIIRYESGKAIPGGRELRILCETLWVSASWLLIGDMEKDGSTGLGQDIENAINRHLESLKLLGMQSMFKGMDDARLEKHIEQRKKWIDEARKSQPRK